MDGALILDKPAGLTSHDVVLAARRLLAEKRIGHLGTLDPFATGVLVLLAGRATRLARFFCDRDKTYQGIVRFGYATDTMDRTGCAVSEDADPRLNEDELRRIFADFVGPYVQRPPAFSAKKISGVRAYRLARRGMRVELTPMAVVIHSLELTWVEGTRAGFETKVSSGTYIRSLVNDLGERTKSGAHLAELRRTAIGEFTEPSALKLGELEERMARGSDVLIPLEELLPEFPSITLTESEARRAGHGNDLTLNSEAGRLRLMNSQGRLIGIGERIAENLYHPLVVLVTEDSNSPAGAGAGSGVHRAAGVR